jgi:hypothetical protein
MAFSSPNDERHNSYPAIPIPIPHFVPNISMSKMKKKSKMSLNMQSLRDAMHNSDQNLHQIAQN